MPTHTQMTIIGSKVSGTTGLGGSGGDFGFDGDTSAGGTTTVTIPTGMVTSSAQDDTQYEGNPVNCHFRISLDWSNTSQLSYTFADYAGLKYDYASTGTTFLSGDVNAANNNYHVEYANVANGLFYLSSYNSLATITQKAAPTTGTVSLSNASSGEISNIQARWKGVAATFNQSNEAATTYSTSGTNVTSYNVINSSGATTTAFVDSLVTIKPQIYGGSAGNSQFFEIGVFGDSTGSSNNPDLASITLTSGGSPAASLALEIIVTRDDGNTQTLTFSKPYVGAGDPYMYVTSGQ